jgi:hypothetical protein
MAPAFDPVEVTWSGNDEMDEDRGDGWAELQGLEGQICFQGGDEIDFIAKPWISSTVCPFVSIHGSSPLISAQPGTRDR